MNNTLLHLPRRFQLWRYNVSHRQLLLRSTKEPDVPTRVDVLFKGVAAVKLCVEYSSLTIRKATSAESTSIANELRVVMAGKDVFLLDGSECSGYVVAGSIEHSEDAGEYDEPSHVFSGL